jgi:glycosyltransferase involved in cell wall biosynthesis
MLSAIIATHESEHTLVSTLSALVPAVTAGLLREVLVADASSSDATEEVADFAGCRFLSSPDPLGVRLKAAAAAARAPWLLFLRAGTVPEPSWVGAAEHFIRQADMLEGAGRAAVFRRQRGADLMRPELAEMLAMLRLALGGGPKPEQGLLIARRFYETFDGHAGHDGAEAALLRRLGRRRIAMLAAGASAPR